jgi:hypothetical protein
LEHHRPTASRIRTVTNRNPRIEILRTTNSTSYPKYRQRSRSSKPRRTGTPIRKNRHTHRSNISRSHRTHRHVTRNPSVNTRTTTSNYDQQNRQPNPRLHHQTRKPTSTTYHIGNSPNNGIRPRTRIRQWRNYRSNNYPDYKRKTSWITTNSIRRRPHSK